MPSAGTVHCSWITHGHGVQTFREPIFCGCAVFFTQHDHTLIATAWLAPFSHNRSSMGNIWRWHVLSNATLPEKAHYSGRMLIALKGLLCSKSSLKQRQTIVPSETCTCRLLPGKFSILVLQYMYLLDLKKTPWHWHCFCAILGQVSTFSIVSITPKPSIFLCNASIANDWMSRGWSWTRQEEILSLTAVCHFSN